MSYKQFVPIAILTLLVRDPLYLLSREVVVEVRTFEPSVKITAQENHRIDQTTSLVVRRGRDKLPPYSKETRNRKWFFFIFYFFKVIS